VFVGLGIKGAFAFTVALKVILSLQPISNTVVVYPNPGKAIYLTEIGDFAEVFIIH
jgi:hypothetical protein